MEIQFLKILIWVFNMAIKFYLYEINNAHEIHCNTNSTITEVAGAFDLGTIELEWNECKYALLPNTPFFIEDTITNKIWSFIIAEDNIEIVQKNPIKYLHRLTLSQSIHKLNNVPLRNTVFTQPYSYQRTYQKSTFFVAPAAYSYGEKTEAPGFFETDHSYNRENLLKANYSLTLKQKIKNVRYKVTTVLNVYNHYSYGINAALDQNPIGKYINQYVGRVVFTIRNPNDLAIGNITVDSDNLGKELKLDDSLLEAIQEEDYVYFELSSTSYVKSTASNLIPSSYSDWSGYEYIYGVFLAGFAKLEIYYETYNYTLWDVLDILNKQCKKEYNHNSLADYYTMPIKTSGEGLELNSIIAPELNFTNMDLYEAVAKTLSYIDAFPVLKIDTINGTTYNNVLSFQYLNNLSENEINNLIVSDAKATLNETNFTNKLSAYYQNAKLTKPITYPQSNLYKRPTNTKYGVPDRNDWWFIVNKPIDYVKKFTWLSVSNQPPTFPGMTFFNGLVPGGESIAMTSIIIDPTETQVSGKMEFDITNAVFPNDIYGNLAYGKANKLEATNYNSLYYNRGDNKIYLGEIGNILGDSNDNDVLEYALKRAILWYYGYRDKNEDAHIDPYNYSDFHISYVFNDTDIYKDEQVFNCEYIPIIDGKVAQESTINKVEKETIVAQNSGSTDLNRLGNNLQGLIAKLGNEEDSITLPITNFKDKIELGSKYIDELGNNWFANRIQTTFTTDEEKVIVNAIFTKNYNAMAQFTELNQEKRFYEISEKLTTTGYENLNEFIYFTTNKNLTVSHLSSKIALNEYALQSILKKTLGDISVSGGYSLSDKHTTFECSKIQIATNEYDTFVCPIVYGCGNQICFEISYEQPLIVGNRYYNGETKSCFYAGEEGIADNITIEAKFQNLDYINDPWRYPEAESEVFVGQTCFRIMDYKYYKKPNEIFHVNYSLNFLPYWTAFFDDLGTPQYTYEEIYFGDKFINENGIIPNNMYEGIEKKLYLYLCRDKFSIIDNTIPNMNTATSVETRISTMIYVDSQATLTGTACSGIILPLKTNQSDPLEDNTPVYFPDWCISWCIADEEGNIYIAVNRNENSYAYAGVSFFTSRNRKIKE